MLVFGRLSGPRRPVSLPSSQHDMWVLTVSHIQTAYIAGDTERQSMSEPVTRVRPSDRLGPEPEYAALSKRRWSGNLAGPSDEACHVSQQTCVDAVSQMRNAHSTRVPAAYLRFIDG